MLALFQTDVLKQLRRKDVQLIFFQTEGCKLFSWSPFRQKECSWLCFRRKDVQLAIFKTETCPIGILQDSGMCSRLSFQTERCLTYSTVFKTEICIELFIFDTVGCASGSFQTNHKQLVNQSLKQRDVHIMQLARFQTERCAVGLLLDREMCSWFCF